MSLNRTSCDSELLKLSLGDRLNEQQEEHLAAHLSHCLACQREMERLAGAENEWEQVRDALRQEASSSHDRAKDISDEDAAADFAVDFLEPSAVAGAIGRIGDIDILEVIGRGGMGVVLKGFQSELKRLVAVKVLAPHLAISGSARQRFSREAQATAAILHPNVVPILTVHSAGKLPFLLMPFLACESLQERLNREGALELVDILRIGLQTARGLAAAHAQGIVHRDVKPANILLEKGVDRVMLTDFGLARAIDDASITRTGVIAGTPQYMSPEQARGDAIDARSDLFSLGSVLYTMATGRAPFRAETTYGILRRITDSPPRPIREINSTLPLWLPAIIDKLLAKQPSERFSSANDVALLFEQCLAHVQQPAVSQLPDFCRRSRGRRWAPARKSQWVILTGIAFLTIGASALLVTRNFRLQNDPIANRPAAIVGPAVTSPELQKSHATPHWDAVQQDLDRLSQDGMSFESRVERLWDRLPASVPPASSHP